MNIRCDAATPPECNGEATFSAESYKSAALTLPAASVAAYSKAEVWKKFKWFITSGVEAIEADDTVAEYFSLDGVKVTENQLRAKQLYICRRGGTSKVILIP